MSYHRVLVIHLVLEFLELQLPLGIQGLLGVPQYHLLPEVLTDPAGLGNRYHCPPVTTETVREENHLNITRGDG